MTGDTASERTPRKRRSILLLALTCLVVSAGITGMLVVRTENPDVSSDWPRPYDPAKPFNMLGVPGVSVEQRKRAEDLLVRSLKEAPRWSDYQAAVDDGWNYSPRLSKLSSVEPATSAKGSGAAPAAAVWFEHRINPLLLNDGRMLDPQYPESLVYKIKNGKRTFVAYMYIAESDIPLDDPRIAGFAGRLIEWHDHSDVCWQFEDEQLLSRITGFKSTDGSCPTTDVSPVGLDPELFTGELGLDFLIGFGSMLMTHVWVVERECGPFSALEGPLTLGVSTTPFDERVDICEH
jgi:hypothetical protein